MELRWETSRRKTQPTAIARGVGILQQLQLVNESRVNAITFRQQVTGPGRVGQRFISHSLLSAEERKTSDKVIYQLRVQNKK